MASLLNKKLLRFFKQSHCIEVIDGLAFKQEVVNIAN